MLDIYTHYLIYSFGQAFATGLARLLSNEISHDSVAHFLSAEPRLRLKTYRGAYSFVESCTGITPRPVFDLGTSDFNYAKENCLKIAGLR